LSEEGERQGGNASFTRAYLPQVAIPLNNLGIFDSDKNQLNEARKDYEEALKIQRELAHKKPATYLPYIAVTLNNLGILIVPRTGQRRRERHLKRP
jgi:hypothetical protein